MDVVVAGGTENMSQMPTLLPGKIQKIFNELFTLEDKNFLKLINDYCFKDTTEIKKYLNIDTKKPAILLAFLESFLF
jgi:acetyl-CoA acyltransferase